MTQDQDSRFVFTLEKDWFCTSLFFKSRFDMVWQITLEPARFSEEFFDLYVRYQVAIHDDPVDKLTRRQFADFLVETPLIVSFSNDNV